MTFFSLFSWLLQLKWPASHGKGVVDGNGGGFKAAIWRRVRVGKTIATARACAPPVRETCLSIEALYVPSEDIAQNEEELSGQWEGLKSVSNMHRIHAVQTGGPIIEFWWLQNPCAMQTIGNNPLPEKIMQSTSNHYENLD